MDFYFLARCHPSEDYKSVPGSCRKFKRCSNGYLYIFRCPDHLVWCEKCKTCARPEQVPAPCGTKKVSYPSYPVYQVQPAYPTKPAYPTYPTPAPYPAY